MDRYELAWAAGFFDGEGWADLDQPEGRRTGQPHARVNQADASGVPEVLDRFRRALGGLGRIGGPHREEGRIDLYRWEATSRGDVELLHHLLLPWLGQVKLLALATALERETARSREARVSDEWRAWAAGAWDGEGSAYLLDHRTHAGYKIAEVAITQGGEGAAPELLRRFATIVRRGHVNGPYRQDEANLDVFRWKTSARADVLATIDELWPWLSGVKRLQADAVRGVLLSQDPLPRGRPEWGSYKSHCIHGHEYATARMRPYVSRGVGIERRDNEQCLQCVREQARARREEKKRSAADDDRRSMSEHSNHYLLK